MKENFINIIDMKNIMGILKKILIIFVITIAIVGALGYFTLFHDNSSTTLTIKSGKARINSLEKENGEYKINNGDIIETFENTQAQIITSDNNIIFLESNTEITFKDNSEATNIKVNKGEIWNKVVSLFGKKYEVEGNYVVATVRGTAFGFNANGGDEIFVGEGEVDANGEKVAEGEQFNADSKGSKKSPMSEKNKEKVKKYLTEQFKSYNQIINKRLTRNTIMKALVDSNVDESQRKQSVKDFLVGDLDESKLKKYNYLLSSKDEKLIDEIKSDRERALKYYSKEELKDII